jgi:hypothetical protein
MIGVNYGNCYYYLHIQVIRHRVMLNMRNLLKIWELAALPYAVSLKERVARGKETEIVR